MIALLGYAVLYLTAAASVGYAAVKKFAVVQRAFAAAIDRGLRKIAEPGDGKDKTYTVQHTETGVVVTGLRVSKTALRLLGVSGVEATSAEVARAEFTFPSIHKPMEIRINTVRVNLQQVKIPETVSKGTIKTAERKQRQQDKLLRLEVLEELLWGPKRTSKRKLRSWNPVSAYLHRLQARAVQKGVAFVTQFVRLDLTDAQVQYTQYGEPGPRPANNYLQGADAAVLRIRAITLAPKHVPKRRNKNGSAGDLKHIEEEMQNLPEGFDIDDVTDSPSGSDDDDGAPDTAFEGLASLSHLLWAHVVTDAPSSTVLGITGVDLLIKTYPTTWHQGQMAHQRASTPQPGLFGFSAMPSRDGNRSSQYTSPGKRRRRADGSSSSSVGAARRLDIDSVGGASNSTQAEASSVKDQSAASSSTNAAAATRPGYEQMLDKYPVEEHIIFQQWELSVVVSLLPPGYQNYFRNRDGTSHPSTPLFTSPVKAQREAQPSSSTVVAREQPPVVEPLAGGSIQSSPSGDLSFRLNRPASIRSLGRFDSLEQLEQDDGSDNDPFYTPPDSPRSTTSSMNGDAPHYTAAIGAENGSSQQQQQAASTSADTLGSSTLDVAVSLKALIFEVTAASTAACSRMIDRQLHVARYGRHWQQRPQVPVKGNEAIWWQHAGRAILAECRKLSRRQVPLEAMVARREKRQEYMDVYAASQVSTPGFLEPGRRWWWQRRQISEAHESDIDYMKGLEEHLTLEQIAHFRLAVAATHNRWLASDFDLLKAIADKVDAVVYHRGPLSPTLIDQLLLKDRPDISQDNNASSADNDGVFGLRVSLVCPKVAIAFDMRQRQEESASSSTVEPSNRPSYVVVGLHSICADLLTDGGLTCQIEYVDSGGCEAPTAPVETKLLSGPSTMCQSICKAGDFFRYAVNGTVLSESIRQNQNVCLDLTLIPRSGRGGTMVADPSIRTSHMNDGGPYKIHNSWKPGGYDITLHLAALGISYNGPLAAGVLSFAEAVEDCKHQPWMWQLSSTSVGTGGVNTPNNNATNEQQSPLRPPPLPSSHAWESVAEMVLHSFSNAHLPVLGETVLPSTTFDLHCPGIAVQLPYTHTLFSDLMSGKSSVNASNTKSSSSLPTADSIGGGADGASTSNTNTASDGPGLKNFDGELLYMFNVVVQTIRVHVSGEDFDSVLQGGSATRVDAGAYVDVFSYLSPTCRQAIARNIMPSRVFDRARRQFMEEEGRLQSLEEELREIELLAMAKVWAYPEDMPAIVKATKEREASMGALGAQLGGLGPARGATSSQAAYAADGSFRPSSSAGANAANIGGASSGLSASLPELTRNPSAYPVPLVPYFKAGQVRCSMTQRLSATPEEPGGAALGVAVNVHGIQAWVSPLHVWHLVSVEGTLKRMFDYFKKSAIGSVAVAHQSSASKNRPNASSEGAAPVTRYKRRMLASFEASHISVLWLIGTWTPKGPKIFQPNSKYGPLDQRFGRSWGITVKRGDPAYVWAQWLAPVYSMSLARISGGLRVHHGGAVAASAAVDGIIVRDLQLPDAATHAYVLRPLPARSRRLNKWIHDVRRSLLGITPKTQGQMLWGRAVRMILLRQKTASPQMLELLTPLHSSSSSSDASSNRRALQCLATRPVLGPQLIITYMSAPPVGNRGGTPLPAELMVEVGQMLAYARIKQHASIIAFVSQLSLITKVVLREKKEESHASTSSRQRVYTPTCTQSALRVDIVIVGIDVLFRVQSKDLMSLKLNQGRVIIDNKAVTRLSSPQDIKTHVSATVQDIMIQDVRAPPEHSLVLIPGDGSEYCSLNAIYAAHVDATVAAPMLSIDLTNPRILVLFRFVHDAMQAVDIIQQSIAKTKAAANPRTVQVTPAAITEPSTSIPDANANAPKQKPLEIMIQLQNVGIVLPTNADTRTVLEGEIEHLTLAIPGNVLPTDVLEAANLPSIDGMVSDSLLSSATYKYSSFHDNAKAKKKEQRPTSASSTATAATTTTAAAAAKDGTATPQQDPTVASGKVAAATTAAAPQDSGEMRPRVTVSRTPSPMKAPLQRKTPASGSRTPGVLFFEEQQSKSKVYPGVLHLPDSEVSVDAAAKETDINEHLQDNVLAIPKAVAQHFAGRVVDMVNEVTKSDAEANTSGVSVDARAESGGGLHREAGVEPSGVPEAQEEESPESSIALCVEGFKIKTGNLIRVPNMFYKTPVRSSGPQGSLLPPSLSSFSWPSQIYEVVSGAAFLHEFNLGMTIFKRETTSSQLHFAATPLNLTLNAPNYTALMDFVNGNLQDYLKPDGGPSPPPSVTPSVCFNPDMHFGPPVGQNPTFRLTVGIPRVTIMLEAHPREWTERVPVHTFVSSMDAQFLKPFLHISASNFLMDLGTLATKDTYINVCATSLDAQDLRLGYRLAEVSSRVPSGIDFESITPRAGNSFNAASSMVNPIFEEEKERTTSSVYANIQQRSQDRARAKNMSRDDSTLRGIHTAADYAAAAVEYVDNQEASEITAANDDEGIISPTMEYISPPGSFAEFWAGNELYETGSEGGNSPHTPTFSFNSNAGGSEANTGGVSVTPNLQMHTSYSGYEQQQPQTGIKLTVARRLSEHSHRHRESSLTPTGDEEFASQEQQKPSPYAAVQTPGRLGPSGYASHYLPVVDFMPLPGVQPSNSSEDTAVLSLLTAPHRVPLEEAPPSSARSITRLPGSNPNLKLEVSVGILADATVAVEVSLSNALVQWAYFQDLSLIWSVSNIFAAPNHPHRSAMDKDAPPPSKKPQSIGPTPWLYFNAVLTESEIFLPVFNVKDANELATRLWEGLAGGSAAQRSEFHRIADLALAAMLLDSTKAENALPLEDRGLALGAAVARLAYAYGGDGEKVIKADFREFVAFVRDPRACVNCVIQPFSCSAELDMRLPHVAEAGEAEKLNNAAIVIQRHWRVYAEKQRLRKAAVDNVPATTFAAILQSAARRPSLSSFTDAAYVDTDRVRQWKLVDDLVNDVASPNARDLLANYKKAHRDRAQLMHLSQFRTISTTAIKVEAGVLTLRAAFSHVAFWKEAVDGFTMVVLKTPDEPEPVAATTNAAVETTPQAVAPAPATKAFTPSSVQVSAEMQTLAVVLCNDKPETFGAPDVFQFNIGQVGLAFDAATTLPDRPANRAARITVAVSSNFLNSGTSRWEPVLDSWPLRAEYVDINSSTYISDRKTNLWLSSDRHLSATFNPASLLSVGDAMAFMRAFSEDQSVLEEMGMQLTLEQQLGTTNVLLNQQQMKQAMHPSAAAMATSGGRVTARAPQKYLVQNQSGMRVHYWAGNENESSSRRSPVFSLENGVSETLKVLPASKRMTFVRFTSSSASTERIGSMINLHFEGNWMPISDVAINVVGKYRYNMLSPADNTTVPVIVDIILVGRTKIITLHSGVWVENRIDRNVSLRLHIPTTLLVPPASSGAERASQPQRGLEGDVIIGPLAPKAGCYLPLTAALGGLLFLQPDGYMEASRDVIRLSANLDNLLNQQGYITCDPEDDSFDSQPLHMALQATPAKLMSEFQAFKHMECVASGTIQRATSPLEVSLNIEPTMVIENSLPYEMRLLLWQVAPETKGGSTESSSPSKWGGTQTPYTPAVIPGNPGIFDMLSPRTSAMMPKTKPQQGRYFCYTIPPGGQQDGYVDMRQNVLMHIAVEEINMRSTKWTACTMAQTSSGKNVFKLPKELSLRLLGIGMPLPTQPVAVPTYLAQLKAGAAHLRSVHAQYNKDARLASSRADIEKTVQRVRSFARKFSKVPLKALTSLKHTGSLKMNRHVEVVPLTSSTTSAGEEPMDVTAPSGASPPPSPFDQPQPVTDPSTSGVLGVRRGSGVQKVQVTSAAAIRQGVKSALKPTKEVEMTALNHQEEDDNSQLRAPPVLYLGIQNSLSECAAENTVLAHAGACRLTLYVPYWMNNRTGVDLFYVDHESVPGNPLLFGYSLPGSFGEVFAPGTSMTADREGGSSEGPWSRQVAPEQLLGAEETTSFSDQAVLEYKLVLMNKQESVQLGLAHVPKRRYSQGVRINTVGNKGNVELRGPPAKLAIEDTMPYTTRGSGAAIVSPPIPEEEIAAVENDDENQATPIDGRAAASAQVTSPPSYQRRTSISGDRIVDVISYPGTQLVRMSSSIREKAARAARHLTSSKSRAGVSSLDQPAYIRDSIMSEEDVEAALQQMQRLPEVPEAKTAEPSVAAAPAAEVPTVAVNTAPPVAETAAVSQQQQPDTVPDTGSEVEITEIEEEGSAIESSEASAAFRPSATVRRQFYLMPEEATASQMGGLAALGKDPDTVVTKRSKKGKVQRLFEFALDVAAGPPDSIYRHTKLVTLKPKYIIENQTGLPLSVKQIGTPDPDDSPWASAAATASSSHRFSQTLMPGQRAAVYWDDADLAKELVVRPRPSNEPDDWNWSGGFPIPDTEWYFGLRIRHREGSRQYMNIPVNVTVGASGSVQVTLKSPASVPPYRIENMCKDVLLYFLQVPLVFRERNRMYMDFLQPSESMAYAWDEPTMLNKLRVQAKVQGKDSEAVLADYALDRLGDVQMLLLPTHGNTTSSGSARRLYRTLSTDLPDELKQKLVSLLAAEFSKKVYVTVYADGPTRVLRFSDEKNISSLEQQHVILDLAARLKQVERQLTEVSGRFSRLHGGSGERVWGLDLYGRMAQQRRNEGGESNTEAPDRAVSRRMPMSHSAQVLVRYVSSHFPKQQQATGGALQRNSSSTTTAVTANSGGSDGEPGIGLGDRATSSKSTSVVRFQVPESGSMYRTSGVLKIEEANEAGPSSTTATTSDREDRLLPYRRLVIKTDSNRVESPLITPPEPATTYTEEDAGNTIVEIPDDGNNEAPLGLPPLPGAVRHRRATSQDQGSKDWGHITPEADPIAAGTRRVPSMLKINSSSRGTSRQGGTTAPTAGLRRRQELLRDVADSDAVLLIGGDLNVTVVQACGLAGSGRSTHAFARVRVKEPVPLGDAADRAKQTMVVWQSSDPVWDEQLMFRDICAASELIVELFDLGGTRSTAQLNKLASNPSEVIKSCRFLGRAEIPLTETLDVPAGTPLWFPLMRRNATDIISGQLQLRFLWDVTARGLLTIKLAALERVLAQRREILAALQPVPYNVIRTWAKPPQPATSGVQSSDDPSKQQQENKGQGFSLFGIDIDSNAPAASWAGKPSSVATEVLARHAHDHNRRHLAVTILEAKGLNPRRGVVVALSANELPNPVVVCSIPGAAPQSTPVLTHTLNPRWSADKRLIFTRVDPSQAELTVTLGDQRGGVRRKVAPIGTAVIHCSHMTGDNPVYMWLPLALPRKGRKNKDTPDGPALHSLPEDGPQVFVRIQWQTEVTRGSSGRVEVDAAGASLMVVGGLQDELFNLTVDSLKLNAVRTRLELTLSGTVDRLQLDNQMLSAVEPVVLAPASGAGQVGSQQGPLLSFGFVRSFAGSSGGPSAKAITGNSEEDDSQLDTASEDGGGGLRMTRSNSDHYLADTRDASENDRRAIRSFKDLHLDVAPLDLMTDEGFLEALLSFLNSLPTADVHQDPAWRDQQQRLLTAQFGPREVESLAINAVVPAPGHEVAGGALDWVVEKEAKDLEALHGQSDLSSWFFIESARIGEITANVTVSLSSRVLNAGQQLAGNRGSSEESSAAGQFNRTLGASGFQLVNVSNVPISLGKWLVGNDPSFRGKFSNGFLSQRALASNLVRHYSREALKEAHKVVGGSGPAVASVPLTVLWASGSIFTLVASTSSGEIGLVDALQQVFYLPFMMFSMFISGFSRMLAAGMAFIPPERQDGDSATVRRLIRRPNNALEALGAAPREAILGFTGALKGVVLDPVTGWHDGKVLGFIIGGAKGLIGLPVRPITGILEMTSLGFASVALTALGREGIVGKVQRRMRAPGAFADDGGAPEVGNGIGGITSANTESQAHLKSLMSAWQRVLPEFFPEMADDTVTDVLNVRSNRVVLMTNRHVAYLKARHMRQHSVYKAKWLVPISEIQNIRGDTDSHKVWISHVHKYDLKIFGVWPVQKRKGLRCGSRVAYERTIFKLTRLQQEVQGGMEVGQSGHVFVGANIQDLTILSQPYNHREAAGRSTPLPLLQ